MVAKSLQWNTHEASKRLDIIMSLSNQLILEVTNLHIQIMTHL